MRPSDTSWGGPSRGFPETSSTLAGALRDPAGLTFRPGLETLCQRYWKPVYVYVRAVWARGNDDAKDLTQAFFLWLLEGDALRRYAPERGSFRNYLKVMLRSFVTHQDEALRTLKRGGGARTLSLEGSLPAIEEIVPDPRTADPEKAFERVWLVDLVTQAIDRVRERCRPGREALAFQVYEEYDLAPMADRPTYSALAARLNVKEHDIDTFLSAVRQQVRTEIRADLADQTADEGHLEAEYHALFGS